MEEAETVNLGNIKTTGAGPLI